MNSKRTYDLKLREMIVDKAISNGERITDIAKDLGLPRTSVATIIKNYMERGNCEKKKRGSKPKSNKIHELEEPLLALVNDDVTISTMEMKEKLGVNVNVTTVWRWLKHMKICWKLTRDQPEERNSDDVRQERTTFIKWYLGQPLIQRQENIIFVDTITFNIHMLKSYSRANFSRLDDSKLLNSKWPNITVLMAITCNKIIHLEAKVATSCRVEMLTEFIHTLVADVDTENSTVIVEDAPLFRNVLMRNEFLPCYVRFRPRYSPSLNPCERIFTLAKIRVKKHLPILGTKDLCSRMIEALMSLSEDIGTIVTQYEKLFELYLLTEHMNK